MKITAKPQRYLSFALLIAFATSCGTETANSGQVDKNTQTTKREIQSISALINNASAFEDSIVSIQGITDHICKHSNKRIKITDGTNELRIELGNKLPEATPEILGKKVVVNGIFKMERMNKTMVKAWMIKKTIGHANEEKSEHFNQEMAETDSILQLLETGAIPYYTRYHVDALGYEVE